MSNKIFAGILTSKALKNTSEGHRRVEEEEESILYVNLITKFLEIMGATVQRLSLG